MKLALEIGWDIFFGRFSVMNQEIAASTPSASPDEGAEHEGD